MRKLLRFLMTCFSFLRQGQIIEFFRYLRHTLYAVTHFSTQGNIIMEEPTQALDTKGLKIAVYTCIVGHYDQLLEPQYEEPGIDYYVFTDIDCPASSVWKKIDITQFEEYKALTPTQLNRKIKMLPFMYLPEYDYSLYVDGNIMIIDAISPMIQEMGHHVFGVHYHRTRDCIYDESTRIAYLRKANMTTVNKQIEEYKRNGFPRHYGLYENTILIRNHRDEGVCHLMETWWEEYQKYPTRDQLSLPYIIWKTNYDRNKIHILGKNIDKSTRFKRIKHYHGNK